MERIMCLNNLEKLAKPVDGIGYKVFNKFDTAYYTPIKNTNNPYKKDKWYTDRCTWILQTEDIKRDYPAGYHVFYSLGAAKVFSGGIRALVICKVECKKIVATGYQCDNPVFVCKRIRIIEECV